MPATEGSENPAVVPASKAPVSLETLVSNQLGARRKMHLDRGWDAFRGGDYQAACSEFSLAEGYSAVSVGDRIETVVPLIYARIAAQQFAEAGGSLRWVLENASRASLGAERSFASLVPDLPSQYARRSELDSHLEALQNYTARYELAVRFATENPDARADVPRLTQNLIELKALQVMVEYAVPEARARAVFDADALASAPSPWDGFGKLLRSNESGSGAGSAGGLAPARQKAVEFPFNLFQEAPPGASARPVTGGT